MAREAWSPAGGTWLARVRSPYFLHSWASRAGGFPSLSLSFLIDWWTLEGREERMTGLRVL